MAAVEDSVQYRLFPPIPDGLEDKECLQYLQEKVEEYLAHFSLILVDYIWQVESFNLRVIPAKGSCFTSDFFLILFSVCV